MSSAAEESTAEFPEDAESDALDPALPEPELVGGVTDERLPLRVRLRSLYRFFVVIGAFLPFAVAFLRDRRRWLLFGDGREPTDDDDRRRARKLRETLLELGPAFIKFGQMLSTRPDVLPPAYVEELSALQDRVPAAPWSEAREVLEGELGPVDEVFAEFEREPISGASIGQVYVARLDPDSVGGESPTDVAVKVLRPGVRPRVEADLRVIRTLLPFVTRLAPPGQRFTLENLADEYAATIRQEMDYAHEARRQELVRANFADDTGVRIPPVVAELTTDRVIVSEYVEGTKISNVSTLRSMGVDTTDLADRLLRAYIRMIIEDGVFHADPHPGNLAVQSDGTIVFYDFGLTGTLSERRRDELFEFYVAVASEDIEGVLDAFEGMGALDPDADREFMRAGMELAFDNLRGGEVDVSEVRELVEGFQGTLREFPMRLPRDLALMVRTSTILEGVCYTLDDEFDFVAVVTDYVRKEQGQESARRLLEAGIDEAARVGLAVFRAPTGAERALDRVVRGNVELRATVRDDGRVVTRFTRRVVVGGLATAGIVMTTLAYGFRATVGTEVVLLSAAGTVGLLGLTALSFRRDRGISATPQFTRQNMRERQRGEE
ncbi:ABC1 kinase family protein [Haloglomus halophilum]|uniref:ABC1 kinase family protein n=1 Tax=Haloglomus halophilum TaxID=2962672 RepID=UPI0020C969DA|nr:AarF/ABC1/UbiB kinase family protein [Haloglomus halophilum]